MDATQLTLATDLRLLTPKLPAEGTPVVRPFRRRTRAQHLSGGPVAGSMEP